MLVLLWVEGGGGDEAIPIPATQLVIGFRDFLRLQEHV